MSQNPYDPFPSGAPLPYAMPGVPMQPRRPTSVSVAAIIGLILGVLSMLCAGPSIFLNGAMLTNGGRNPLAPQLPPMDQAAIIFSVIQCVVNFIMALIMVIGCIGALNLKAWARTLLLYWAVPMIVWAIVVCIGTLMITGPAMEKLQAATPMMPGQAAGQRVGMLFGAIFTTSLMCVVPICVLVSFSSAEVKAAFGERT